jgi:hypothetical protein
MKLLLLGYAVFAAAFVSASACNAQPQATGGWWEHGEEKCDDWLGARDAQGADELIYRAWVDGYLAGARKGIGKVPSGPRVASWMDSYCRAHRTTTLMEAVKNLQP